MKRHKLTLDLPEEIYDSLTKSAEQTGQPLEELAVQWLATATSYMVDDPLEKWIGAFPGKMSGWADEHDKYIGESLTLADTVVKNGKA